MQKSREIEIYKNKMWSVSYFDQLQEGDIFRICSFNNHTVAEAVWRVRCRNGIASIPLLVKNDICFSELLKRMSSVGIELIMVDVYERNDDQ